MKRKRVGILVFNKVEVLDFCGPFEVMAAVRLDEARRREEPSPFDIVLVAEYGTAITANGGLRVILIMRWPIARRSTFSSCRAGGVSGKKSATSPCWPGLRSGASKSRH